MKLGRELAFSFSYIVYETARKIFYKVDKLYKTEIKKSKS